MCIGYFSVSKTLGMDRWRESFKSRKSAALVTVSVAKDRALLLGEIGFLLYRLCNEHGVL